MFGFRPVLDQTCCKLAAVLPHRRPRELEQQTSENHEFRDHRRPCARRRARPQPNQFALLGQRRFAPFFWTQFAGAANDNLFKFAFTVMVTYQLQLSWMPPAMAGLVIGALFILPFLLFSATAGQLTDKYDKTRMIRFVKNLEIAIMAGRGLGLLQRRCRGAAGLRVPDGPAFHAVRPGQVRLPAAGARRARAHRRQRHGRDGHLRRHPAGSGGRRPAGGAAAGRPRHGGGRLRAAGAGRARRGAGDSARAGHRSGAGDQLEPDQRNLAQPQAGARQPGGVPLAAGHLAGCGSSARCS